MTIPRKDLPNGSYAQYFRKKSGKRGYLFQDRYKSIVTQDQKYIEELVRYVHLNPIRAGICLSLDDQEKYQWCGGLPRMSIISPSLR